LPQDLGSGFPIRIRIHKVAEFVSNPDSDPDPQTLLNITDIIKTEGIPVHGCKNSWCWWYCINMPSHITDNNCKFLIGRIERLKENFCFYKWLYLTVEFWTADIITYINVINKYCTVPYIVHAFSVLVLLKLKKQICDSILLVSCWHNT
jgi:small-conductance mechanosensitive channel